ncbi:type IV conjugative transfer system protein TraL [Acinetobacter baumannii]
MALTPIEIPDDIDGPPFLLAFESDEVGVYFCIVFACLFTKTNILVMLVLLYAFSKIYVNYKKRSMAGFYIHYPYRWGMIPLNSYFKNGSIMEYKE